MGKFDGVTEQIQKNLLDASRIALDEESSLFADVVIQVQLLFFGPGLGQGNDPMDHSIQ